MMRAMGAFGGGLAGHGEVCGALVGALAVFGLVFSRSREEEKENPLMWSRSGKLIRRFRNEAGEGKILCREIAGIDWSDPEQVKTYYSRGSERQLKCMRLVGDTARILGEILDEIGQEKKGPIAQLNP